MTDYKPGVYLATVNGLPDQTVMRRHISGKAYDWVFMLPDAKTSRASDIDVDNGNVQLSDIRPIVVIDPGNRVDVAALVERSGFYHVNDAGTVATTKIVDALQSALRERVAPPRMREPGLFGVVEARLVRHGMRVQLCRVRKHGTLRWQEEGRPSGEGRFAWDDLIDPTPVRPGLEEEPDD